MEREDKKTLGSLLKKYKRARFWHIFLLFFTPLSYIAMVALLTVGALYRLDSFGIYASAGIGLAVTASFGAVISMLIRSAAAGRLAEGFFAVYGEQAQAEIGKYAEDRYIRIAVNAKLADRRYGRGKK